MLKIKNLSIAYGENIITRDFSMNVNQGEIVCIVGESGCGKTSILKSILGLLPPNATLKSGDILLNSQSILHLSQKKRNKLSGKEISVVFQDAGLSLNPVRKIGTQFVQYLRTHSKLSKEEARSLSIEMIEKMNLSNGNDILNSYTFQLSGGMRQRVGLAFALALHPKLLLLDEPTSALDVTTQAQVVDEILALKESCDTTILMITHNIPLAIYMADYIIVMKNGEIVEENKSVKIYTQPQHPYTKELLENIPLLKEQTS